MNTDEDLAGKIGCDIAESISNKVIQAIHGLPASNPEQRGAIARLMRDHLDRYQKEELHGQS